MFRLLFERAGSSFERLSRRSSRSAKGSDPRVRTPFARARIGYCSGHKLNPAFFSISSQQDHASNPSLCDTTKGSFISRLGPCPSRPRAPYVSACSRSTTRFGWMTLSTAEDLPVPPATATTNTLVDHVLQIHPSPLEATEHAVSDDERTALLGEGGSSRQRERDEHIARRNKLPWWKRPSPGW